MVGKWHREWQEMVPPFRREMFQQEPNGRGARFADIVTGDDVCIEFQDSLLKREEICRREEITPNMVWIFNGEGVGERHYWDPFWNMGKEWGGPKEWGYNPLIFTWTNPRTDWLACTKPVFFDFGGRGLTIHRVHLACRHSRCLTDGPSDNFLAAIDHGSPPGGELPVTESNWCGVMQRFTVNDMGTRFWQGAGPEWISD